MKKRIFQIIAVLCLVHNFVQASGEIQLQGYLKAAKGTREVTRSPGTIAIDWIGSKYYGPVIYSATPAYQVFSSGNVATNGVMWLRNVATNASVMISFNGGTNDHLLIKASEFFCVRLSTNFPIASLWYKTAAAATNDVEITILEN